jgi:hypothetical protein
MSGDKTRGELLRIIEEFKSARDAAESDTRRAIEDRNAALFALGSVNRRMEAIHKLASMDANQRERVEVLAAIQRISKQRP